MGWYLAVLKKYADFKGRARRKEYWMFFLFNCLIAFALGFLLGILGAITGLGHSLVNTGNLIYTLALLIPGIAVGIRRIHDTGKSGWWIIVPIANLVLFCTEGQPHENEYGPNPKANEETKEAAVL
jgi:uncharacterized membrane protein YhaH (DUF805 family)